MGGAAFKETTHEQRIRLRKWMSIISLFPMMNEKDFSMRLPALWLAIGKEPVESIRLYGEWFVSMGMIRFRCGLDDLLDRLQDYTTPTGLVVSFITVLGLVARSYLEHPISSSDNINSNKVDSNENDPSSETLISLSGKPPPSSISNLTNGLLTPKADSNFIKSDCVLNSSPKNNSASSIRGSGHTFEKRTIFDRLQPWLLHNCHTVRLYALHVYDRLWSCLEADDKEKMPEGYCNIITFVSQSLSCRRLLNSVEERIKHPFLNRSFDPIANFNLARVFSALPRFPSERISPVSSSVFNGYTLFLDLRIVLHLQNLPLTIIFPSPSSLVD